MSAWYVGAVILVLYYIYTLMSIGFSEFSLIWLLAGIGLYLVGHVLRKHPAWLLVWPVAVRVGVLVFGCLLLLSFVIVEGLIIRSAFSKPAKDAEYVIVLGAQVDGTEPSASLRQRTMAAAAYMKAYPKSKAIACGGQGTGEDITEALCIQSVLIEAGIPASRIIMEDRSTNTKENLAYAKAMVGAEHSFVIMTCNYHQFRALNIARKLGMQQVSGQAVMSDPTLWPNYYLREYFAVIKYYLSGDI